MAQAAQISSVEAIEHFRSRLLVYLSQMRPILEEISQQATQTEMWLQNDKKRFWELELRKRYRKLEEAKQELFTAKLSKLQEASSLHYMAVQRAEKAVEEAQNKLGLIKKWTRQLEDEAAPLTKQIEQLHGFLIMDMGKAVAYLDQVLSAIAAYRDVAPPGGGSGAGVPPALASDPKENPK